MKVLVILYDIKTIYHNANVRNILKQSYEQFTIVNITKYINAYILYSCYVFISQTD